MKLILHSKVKVVVSLLMMLIVTSYALQKTTNQKQNSNNLNSNNQNTRLLSDSNNCPAITNCNKCQSIMGIINICTHCNDGYTLNYFSNMCQKYTSNEDCSSLPYCSQCQNSISPTLTCVKCMLVDGLPMYLLLNGTCYSLDNFTNNISNNIQQQVQQEINKQMQNFNDLFGHVSIGGKYFKCQPGCAICNSTSDLTNCSQCLQRFALNKTTFTCSLCTGNCFQCDQNNFSSCLSCYPGYALGTNGGVNTCQKCTDSHCGNCSTKSDCQLCKNFYFLDTDKTCKQCITNCRNCTTSTDCTSCEHGYYLNNVINQTQCVICVQGCASCQSFAKCLKCYPGFYLNTNDNTCQKCSTNCWNCNSALNCSACLMGSYLINSACMKMIQNCVFMKPDGTCGLCFWGYIPSSSNTNCIFSNNTSTINTTSYVCPSSKYLLNFTCKPCNFTVQNCQQCINQSCLQCKEGYFVHNSGLFCLLCSKTITGCKSCLTQNYCLKCQDGYFMEQDIYSTFVVSYGNCIKCNVNCLTCYKKEAFCTSCASGYSLTTSMTCVTQNSFDFTLLLNYDYNSFSNKVDQLKTTLANMIKDNNIDIEIKKKFVQLKKITSGSTNVQGSISASNQQSIQDTFTNFQITITSGSTLGNMQVVSASISPIKTTPTTSPISGGSTPNMGIIIGASVGGAVLVIAAVIIIMCCCCKKHQTQMEADQKISKSTGDGLYELPQSAFGSQNQVNNNPSNVNLVPKGQNPKVHPHSNSNDPQFANPNYFM